MIAPCYTHPVQPLSPAPRVMTPSSPPAKSFRTHIALVFGSFTALLTIALCLLWGEILKLRLQQQAATRLNMVAHNTVTLLHEEISQQSHRTQVLARAKELWESGLDADSVRTMLDRVQHINPHNVWIGVADTQGTVRKACCKVRMWLHAPGFRKA